ncbi:hypothetical protein [Micromonospora sp. KLBMP9576]|uniref:hypothetical protein n=1 Tax=Micromonospora sp. KLBMP9576 TaxID=3424769 RepID=UPI003D8F9DD5
MRDDVTLVEQVRRDLRDVRWPEPAEIRARARRRSRCTALTAAVATLAVLSGSAYAAAGRSGSSSPLITAASESPAPLVVAASVSPAHVVPSEIPQEALLAPGDVPLRTGVQLGETGLAEPVRIDPLLESCGHERGVPSVVPTSRYSRSRTLLRASVDPAVRRPALTQDVYRVDPGQGRLVFGFVGMLLNACAQWQLTGSALVDGRPVRTVDTHRWEAPVSGFAGDESVMLRHVSLTPRGSVGGPAVAANPSVEVTVVVRVGDLVTVVATGPDTVADTVDARPGQSLSNAYLETLGRTAARRMCVASNPGC